MDATTNRGAQHERHFSYMRISAKLGLAALAAALLLSAAISTASARNLSISNQNMRASFSRLEFRSSLVTIRCQVTLEGSFSSRTIQKVLGTLIGRVTRVEIKNESCTNGTAAISNLPWHITYEGFRGTLPRIETLLILLREFRFQVRTLGISCDYGNATDRINSAAVLNESGEITNLAPLEGENLAHRVSGSSELCPAVGRMEGSGSVMLLGTTTRIRVTLI